MGVLQQTLRTPLGMTAALCVCGVVGVMLYQSHAFARQSAQALSFTASSSPLSSGGEQSGDIEQEKLLLGLSANADPSASSSNDPIAMIGPVVVAQLAGSYAGLQDSGKATADNITQSASALAANIKAAISYKTYTVADLHTDSDTSYQAMMRYRDAMRGALEPLLANSQNELDLYAKYVETSDASYLTALDLQAKNYHAALTAAAGVTVPRDAVNYQKDVLNALGKFASVLDQMVAHQGDVLAQAALIRSYDDAESSMYNSFNALSAYYSQKTP